MISKVLNHDKCAIYTKTRDVGDTSPEVEDKACYVVDPLIHFILRCWQLETSRRDSPIRRRWSFQLWRVEDSDWRLFCCQHHMMKRYIQACKFLMSVTSSNERNEINQSPIRSCYSLYKNIPLYQVSNINCLCSINLVKLLIKQH